MKGMFDTFTSSGEAQKMEFALKRNGYTREQFERLVAGDFLGLVRELVDLPLEFVRWLSANLSLLREVYDGKTEICRVERLSSAAKNFASGETYTLHIGGPETTDQLVKRIKKQGLWVNDHITQNNFPLEPRGTEEAELVIIDPGHSFREEKGLRILREAGLESPTYEHAIRFAEQFWKTTKSKKPFVVFLHGPWLDPRGNRRVCALHRPPAHRGLDLHYAGDGWGYHCVLAGVRPRKHQP